MRFICVCVNALYMCELLKLSMCFDIREFGISQPCWIVWVDIFDHRGLDSMGWNGGQGPRDDCIWIGIALWTKGPCSDTPNQFASNTTSSHTHPKNRTASVRYVPYSSAKTPDRQLDQRCPSNMSTHTYQQGDEMPCSRISNMLSWATHTYTAHWHTHTHI